MRLALLAAAAALVLAGCVEGPFGGAARGEATGILPSEARAKADAAALAWREDAVLVTVKGDAHGSEEPGLFTFGNPGTAVVVDGRAGGWQFSYAVPGTVALMMATVDADGEVDTRHLDLTAFTPDTAGYEEYFEMTPIDPAWLDMAALVALLRGNETTRPFTEGEVDSVAYALKPDVRASYAWTVDALREGEAMSVVIDPETWTFLAVKADYRTGASSFETESDAGKPPSGLSVRAAYGSREPGEDLASLRFDLAHSKAGRAFALAELVVEVETTKGARTYRASGDIPFSVVGADAEVKPGTRFSVVLPLPDDERLPPRSHVKVAFVTPKGAALRFEAEAPMTFGKATAVPLQ